MTAGARLSPFPHLSWLGSTFSFVADAGPTAIHLHAVAHSVSLTVSGRHALRWIRQGRELDWIESPGTVHFRPCTGDWQDFLIDSSASGDVLAFFLPPHHLDEVVRSEAMQGGVEWHRLLLPNDTPLQQALLTLGACCDTPAENIGRADEAALLRLLHLSGGGTPDWHDDVSVFERRVLGQLVEYIDAHLAAAPGLAELGMRVGLSPSHLARKFRNSTGLSVQRFINRRRVRAALALLRDQEQSLAGVAVDVGFSSQSHFTRVFGDLTGMTPARYQRRFRPTVG